MSSPNQENQEVVEIRRYTNRRFYDTSQSKHVTLEEIRNIVRDGRNVRITDASTGEDITPRILTQIILDYDDEKITAFPTAMLHRLIRSSETLLLEFMGQYFDNATRLFQESQKSAGEQWQRVANMSPAPQDAAKWWQDTLTGAASPWAQSAAGKPTAGTPRAPGQDLERVVDELRGQLESVQEELKRMREDSEKTAPKASSTPSPKRRKRA